MDNSNNNMQGLGVNTQPDNLAQPTVNPFDNNSVVTPVQPTVEPTPVVAPTVEPVAPAPVVEPTVETVAPAPVVAPTVEPVAPAPVVAPTVEPVAPASVVELTVEPVAPAPVVEPTVEPVAPAPVVEPTVEPVAPAPVVAPTVEPAAQPVEAPTVQPAEVAPVVAGQATQPIADAPQNMDLNALMAPDPSQPSTTPPVDNTNNTVASGALDDDLVKAFVGEKYDKFLEAKFNIGAFFFGAFYLLYRKMFLYGFAYLVVAILISTYVKIPYIGLGLSAALAVVVNKIYLDFAKRKVANIKNSNSAKTDAEIREICARKGGTSVGAAIGGVILAIVVVFVMLIMMIFIGLGNIITSQLPDVLKTVLEMDGTSGGSSTNTVNSNTEIPSNAKVIEDANISVQICMMGTCQISASDKSGNEYTIVTSQEFNDLSLLNYKDYLIVDIYYTESEEKLQLAGYKIYDISTNQELKVSTEEELKSKLGL